MLAAYHPGEALPTIDGVNAPDPTGQRGVAKGGHFVEAESPKNWDTQELLGSSRKDSDNNLSSAKANGKVDISTIFFLPKMLCFILEWVTLYWFWGPDVMSGPQFRTRSA